MPPEPEPSRARTGPPRLLPTYLVLLCVCGAAAIRWRSPAALGIWAASAAVSMLVPAALAVARPGDMPGLALGRLRGAARDLRRLAAGLAARDPTALWSAPGPSRPELWTALPETARDWTVLAVTVSATLAALASMVR